MKVVIELYLYKDSIYVQVEIGNYDSFYEICVRKWLGVNEKLLPKSGPSRPMWAVAAPGNFSRVFITKLEYNIIKKKKKNSSFVQFLLTR
jgi:hypothetical protein